MHGKTSKIKWDVQSTMLAYNRQCCRKSETKLLAKYPPSPLRPYPFWDRDGKSKKGYTGISKTGVRDLKDRGQVDKSEYSQAAQSVDGEGKVS